MEEKERYEVRRLNYSLNVKLTDNYEPDWRYIIFDDVNDKELAKLETVCDLLNQQDKQIKELEEENGCIVFTDGYDENGNEIYKQEYVTYKNRFKELLKEIQQLKQQLAEKEQENERLNLEFETQEDWQEKWQKLYDETCNLTQDKISFAVEQLRQVQKYIITDEKDMFGMPYLMKSSYIYDYIDNQIKQLTHQHEDKGE